MESLRNYLSIILTVSKIWGFGTYSTQLHIHLEHTQSSAESYDCAISILFFSHLKVFTSFCQHDGSKANSK